MSFPLFTSDPKYVNSLTVSIVQPFTWILSGTVMGEFVTMYLDSFRTRPSCKTLFNTICETWTLTKATEEELRRFERKVRKILGAVFDPEDLAWRRRTDAEIMNIYKDNDVVKIRKIGRLRWPGHVARMSPEEVPQKLLDEKIFKKRRLGCPKLRWLDGVAEDARNILGIRTNWRAAENNRDDWRSSVQQALTPRGL